EGCDEGSNNSNGGACTTACATSECGDGFVWIGHEECDNGVNNGNNNACTIACKAARCGDGFTWTGHEECDDGNGDNTHACGNGCLQNICTACPGPPQTHTLPSTTDTNGNNCAGIDFVKTYPARCDDGYHHEACTTTIVATPGDASCDVVGWANPNDPGDCSC